MAGAGPIYRGGVVIIAREALVCFLASPAVLRTLQATPTVIVVTLPAYTPDASYEPSVRVRTSTALKGFRSFTVHASQMTAEAVDTISRVSVIEALPAHALACLN
jgi:hypothetical protein